jgi:hypothetical protein
VKILRMLELLEWIDTTLFWPDFGTEEEKQELLKGGLIMIDGGCCLLTSLGELECGCPETGEKGDK